MQLSALLSILITIGIFVSLLLPDQVGQAKRRFRTAKVDPAVSSAVFVTTATDVMGFFSFLGLASAFGLGR